MSLLRRLPSFSHQLLRQAGAGFRPITTLYNGGGSGSGHNGHQCNRNAITSSASSLAVKKRSLYNLAFSIASPSSSFFSSSFTPISTGKRYNTTSANLLSTSNHKNYYSHFQIQMRDINYNKNYNDKSSLFLSHKHLNLLPYTQVRFMAVPKKKVSHRVQRRKLVRYDIKNLTNIITCKACGKPKLSHRLCEQVELCAKGGLKDHRSNKNRANSSSNLEKSPETVVEEQVA